MAPPGGKPKKSKEEMDRTNEALRIAADVLRNRLSYEEGLVRAHKQRFIAEYIESLNMLSGGHLYSLARAHELIESGELGDLKDKKNEPSTEQPTEGQPDATDTESGHTESEEHPEQEQTSEEGSENKEKKVDVAGGAAAMMAEAELQKLQTDGQKLERELREAQETVKRLTTMSKERFSAPPFWVNGLIFGSLAMGIAVVVFTISILWSVILAMLGAAFTILSMIHDFAHVRRARRSYEYRMRENATLLEVARGREEVLRTRYEAILKRIEAIASIIHGSEDEEPTAQ